MFAVRVHGLTKVEELVRAGYECMDMLQDEIRVREAYPTGRQDEGGATYRDVRTAAAQGRQCQGARSTWLLN